MKWVKASETAPTRQVAAKSSEKYGILFPWFDNTYFFVTTDFFEQDGLDVTNELDGYEWLDESDTESELREQVRKLRDGVGELISTIERNSVDNKAEIHNVKLWAKSWREEILNQPQ